MPYKSRTTPWGGIETVDPPREDCGTWMHLCHKLIATSEADHDRPQESPGWERGDKTASARNHEAGDVSFLLVNEQSRGGCDTTSADVEPVPLVRVLTWTASSVAAGRHHNCCPPGQVKLPGMALGLTRRTRAHPVDLENLAYAAYEFREALIPLQGITPDRCGAAATELRDRALVAEERFFAAVAGLPGRERTLAGHWENAAVMRYRHGLEVFARAEDLGADMLANSPPTGGRLCPRSPNCVTPVPMPAPLISTNGPRCSGPAIPRRATRRLRTAPGDSAGADHDRATGRSCIVDQAELRWRIRRDLTSLLVENAIAGNGITREAERHLVPWLTGVRDPRQSHEHRRSRGCRSAMARAPPALHARRRRSGRRDHRRPDPSSARDPVVEARPRGRTAAAAVRRNRVVAQRGGDVSYPQFITTFRGDRRCD